jgi:hypothetical protein
MQLQLNVHRLVVVYRVPALDALDASTLAVRLCQSPAMPNGRCAFTAVAALAHPEARATAPGVAVSIPRKRRPSGEGSAS